MKQCQLCYKVAVVEVTLKNNTKQVLCNDCYWKLHWTQRKNYVLLPIGGDKCQR